MSQMTIEEALAARDREMARVDEHCDEQWKDRALQAVRLVCELRAEWHSDDIWALTGLDEPREARALGPIMLKAARLGYCRKSDRTRPSVRSHGSGKSVWISLIYRGERSAAA